MARKQRTTRRSSKPRPISPGIPGDYFECNEKQLVQKLHALRRVSINTPLTIPSLLGHMEDEEASLNTAEDNPDFFFEDEEYAKKYNYPNNLVEKMDGEQISLHPDDQDSTCDEASTGANHSSPGRFHAGHGSKTPRTGTSSFPGTTPAAAIGTDTPSRSWEGSEIVLDVNSFVVDPRVLEKLQGDFYEKDATCCISDPKQLTSEERSDSSPRSITKLFQDESHPNQRQRHADQRRFRGTTSSSQSTSETISLSASASSSKYDHSTSVSSSTASKKSKDHVIKLPIHEEEEEEIPQEEKDGIFDKSTKRKSSSARRWSFSSSVGDPNETDHGPLETPPFSFFRSRARPKPPSVTNRDYSSLKSNQELFLKLAEEEDLNDFQHINNFSFEGNYLFTRILRERMRIQLKRDMLHSSDKDFYVETHKGLRDRQTSKTQDRGVFFMI